MSRVVSKAKMNNSCQIGSSGKLVQEIRYITYTYTGNIAANSDVSPFITITLSPPMPSTPILFGNLDQDNGAAAQGIIVSFYTVSVNSFILILRNTSSVQAGNGFSIRIRIMAISL